MQKRSKSYIVLYQKVTALLSNIRIVTIGALGILIAIAAVYGVSSMSSQIQAKPGQTTAPDYSAQLDSIKSQVASLNSQIGSMNSQIGTISDKLGTLDTLKGNVADIQAKLSDIESKTTQVQQTQSTTVPLALLLDKSVYNPGDTIKISAIGVNPLKIVQVQLLDSGGFVIIHKETWSDSTGKLSYDLQLSSSLIPGNYKVQVISDQQTQSQPITIGGQSTSQNTGTFTANTDKSVYTTGNLIQVTGTGPVGTSVTGVMTSPTGKTYSTVVTIQSDGTFLMIFSTPQPYETGQWSIAMTNLAQTKTLYFSLGTGSSSGSSTFTAQADKSVYHRGELVQVTGTGPVGSYVTGTLAGPGAKTYDSNTTVRADGTYYMTFSTIPDDPIGQWNITVTNLGQNKILSIAMR